MEGKLRREEGVGREKTVPYRFQCTHDLRVTGEGLVGTKRSQLLRVGKSFVPERRFTDRE